MTETLPPFLFDARKKAQNSPNFKDLIELQSRWLKFIDDLTQAIPGIIYEQSTELLSFGNLSPGCRFCRQGKWECLFVTQECNLNCSFCYSQNKRSPSFSGSNLKIDNFQNQIFDKSFGICGVSFSGGEALLELKKLYSLIPQFSQNSAIKHKWLYTNGLLLNDEILMKLAELGLNEIRFNTAATNYQHPYVLDMMKKATDLFEWVTVEIPLLSADEALLLDALSIWADHGVQILNIHEFLFEPGSNSEQIPGDRHHISLPDGHKTAIDPNSNSIAFKIFQKISNSRFNLGVNYCSTIGKWKQLTARRELLLNKTKQPHENYLGNGILESFYTAERNLVRAISRNKLRTLDSTGNESIYRLTRMAPLSENEKQSNWLTFEIVP
jgi:pyruvate formate-lyase activating enzyme-like uncharacterized protein